MTPQIATLNSTNEAIQALASQQGYTRKEMAIIANAGNIDLSDPNALAQLKAAYEYMQCVINGTVYYAPDGTKMDFSVYGAGGILGDQKGTVQANITAALKSFGNLKIPSPAGGSVTVVDSTTGKNATLYDLIANPNDTFTFQYTGHSDYVAADRGGQGYYDNSSYTKGVNWCPKGDLPTAVGGQTTNNSHSGNLPGGLSYEATGESMYHGGNVVISVSGNASAIEQFLTIGSSSTVQANNDANTVLNSIQEEM